MPRIVVAEPPLFILVGALAVVYGAYSVVRHDHFQSGLDLGIFDQAIWHYSRFETPASTIAGLPNLLGDHFHPILVLLAPLYWVWSDPRMLLIAQAGLVAASVVPVFLFARPRLQRPGAYLLAIGYGTFWGLQIGIGYEFHEVAFAPLLIALAIWAVDVRRWRVFIVAVALLLVVKEDLSIFVVFLGVYLLTLREFKAGVLTCIAGVVWYELATEALIPHFSYSGHFNYWSFAQLGKDLPDALANILRHPWKPFELAVGNDAKVHTLLFLFVAFMGLTLYSRFVLLALPLLAERFLSTNQQFWGTGFHYSMAIAPVLAMGATAGLAAIAGRVPVGWRGNVFKGGALAMVIAGGLVSLAVPGAPLKHVVQPGFWEEQPYVGTIRRALAQVPSGASVMVQDALAPHLAHRESVTEIQSDRGLADYLVANVLDRHGSPGPAGSYPALQTEVAQRLGHYDPVFLEGGWFVGRLRRGNRAAALPQALTPTTRADTAWLLSADLDWERARVIATADVVRCAQLTLRGNPQAGGCWATAGVHVQSREPLLAARLATVASTLPGSCGHLADATRAGLQSFGEAIGGLRRAGLRGSRARLLEAGAQLRRVVERDLAGRLQRFILICTRPEDLLAAFRAKSHS